MTKTCEKFDEQYREKKNTMDRNERKQTRNRNNLLFHTISLNYSNFKPHSKYIIFFPHLNIQKNKMSNA